MLEINRIIRERNTIERMIRIYCKSHNDSKHLCEECNTILDYIYNRIENCRFGGCKPVCSKCNIYCYNKEMKENIKQVMRYSGRRMLIYHPFLTSAHVFDVIHSMKYQNTYFK